MKTLEFIKLNESGANNVVASLQQLLAFCNGAETDQ